MWLFGMFILGELGNNSFITSKPVLSKQWTSVAPAKRLYYTLTTGATLIYVLYVLLNSERKSESFLTSAIKLANIMLKA